jgi:hypothetical protein
MAEPRHPQIHAFVVPSDHQNCGSEEAAEADQNFGKSSERPIRGDSHTGHMSAMPLKSRQTAGCERFWIDERSVGLAARVVPWHTFNLVGFGPVNLKACHT